MLLMPLLLLLLLMMMVQVLLLLLPQKRGSRCMRVQRLPRGPLCGQRRPGCLARRLG